MPACAYASTADYGIPQSFPDRFVASRPLRMLLIFAALWMANIFDAGLTLLAHAQGVLHEMNPVGVWLLSLGPQAVIGFKLATLIIATGLLWWARRHPLAELAAWVELSVYILVSFRWRAYYEVYASLGDLSALADPGSYVL